jgi:hypothetical protein
VESKGGSLRSERFGGSGVEGAATAEEGMGEDGSLG